jgi:hypothetical protein
LTGCIAKALFLGPPHGCFPKPLLLGLCGDFIPNALRLGTICGSLCFQISKWSGGVGDGNKLSDPELRDAGLAGNPDKYAVDFHTFDVHPLASDRDHVTLTEF